MTEATTQLELTGPEKTLVIRNKLIAALNECQPLGVDGVALAAGIALTVRDVEAEYPGTRLTEALMMMLEPTP